MRRPGLRFWRRLDFCGLELCSFWHQHLGPSRLTAAAKRMDVDGKLLDGFWIKPVDPRRHHAAAAIADIGHDCLLVPGIKPQLIGQIWGSEFRVALAVGPMTWRAG